MTDRSPGLPPAVVLGLASAGLTVIRSLSRLGVDVYGVYSDPTTEIARHSRHLRGRYRVQGSDSDRSLLRLLASIRHRFDPATAPVLIPTSDRYTQLLMTHRQRLERSWTFNMAETALVETFLDKRALVELLREHAITAPRACVPNTFDDIRQAANDFTFPVIVKPARHDDAAFPGKNVVMADGAQLLAFFETRKELIVRCVLQEFVPSGDGHNLIVASYSDRNGDVLALCTGRKLRQWRPDVGFDCFGVSETVPELQASMRRFLAGIGYVGFAGIEFAEHVGTGELYFLELNPRVVYDSQLWVDAGVDLSVIGYLEMCGSPPERVGEQADGVYWLDLPRDIASFAVSWLRGRIGLSGWLRSIGWASSFAAYDRDDPKPFVASLLWLVRQGSMALRLHAQRTLMVDESSPGPSDHGVARGGR